MIWAWNYNSGEGGLVPAMAPHGQTRNLGGGGPEDRTPRLGPLASPAAQGARMLWNMIFLGLSSPFGLSSAPSDFELCLLHHRNVYLIPTVYTDSAPGRVFWGADEEVSDGGTPRVIVLGYDGLPMQPVAPPSPDYVPGPEHPASPDYVPGPEHPPSPIEIPYVPEPEYPEYLVPSEDEAPIEDQPLPAVAHQLAISRAMSLLRTKDEARDGGGAPSSWRLFAILWLTLTDIPEADMPPRKRACLTTPAPGYEIGESSAWCQPRQPGLTPAVDTWDQIVEAMMEIAPTTLEGVDQRVTELDTTVRQRTEEFETRFEEAHDDRAYLGALVNTLYRERLLHRRTGVGYNAVGPPTEHLGRIATIEARDQNVTQQEEATEDNTCHRNHFIPPCYLRTQLQAINCSGDAAASSSTRCQEEQAMANNKTWFTGKRRRRSRGPEHNHGPRNDWNMFSLSATVLLKVQGRDQKARESEYWTPEGVKGVTCPPKAEEWISRESGAGYGNAVEELMCGHSRGPLTRTLCCHGNKGLEFPIEHTISAPLAQAQNRESNLKKTNSSDFTEVFPEDLPGIPPTRQVEFSQSLITGAAPCPVLNLGETPVLFVNEDDGIFRDVFMDTGINKQEHAEHLKLILELLKKEQLYAKFSKCEFWIPKVQFLGHVIDSQGIHVDPAKIESVKDWASPKSEANVVDEALSKKERSKAITALGP
ncbi:hypothetical protein Tco_0149842 [Tanacetum coccineum]